MQTSIVDTRECTYQLWSSLDNLDNYMGTVNSNIKLFNIHVRYSHEGLLARGQKVDHLVMKMCKGYGATSDNNFIEYITKKEDNYLKGTEYEPDELMYFALNRYTVRKKWWVGCPYFGIRIDFSPLFRAK